MTVSGVTLTKLDNSEILRYLGYRGEVDEGTKKLLDSEIPVLLSAISPRWVWEVFSITHEDGGVRLSSGLLLEGKNIKKNLTGCTRAVLLAVTLSAQGDAIIRRAENSDMARALVLDCCATTAIEQVCDIAEQEIHTAFSGCVSPPRFSPGYGDLPLTIQNDVLRLLDAPRKIGLCVTDSHILTPRKSVTAIIGISETQIIKQTAGCPSCTMVGDCHFRKTGVNFGLSHTDK